MGLNEALMRRNSQRRFMDQVMSEKALSAFLGGLNHIELLHPNDKLTIRFLTYGEVKERFPSYYRSLIYAPYYLFFYAEQNDQVMENIGYLGELSSLWLQMNGYASCWQVVKGLEQTFWPQYERVLQEDEAARKQAEAERKERAKQLEEMKIEPKDLVNANLGQAPTQKEEISAAAASTDQSLDQVEQAEASARAVQKENSKNAPASESSIELEAETEELIHFPNKPLEQVFAFGIPDRRMSDGRPAPKKSVESLLIPGSPAPSCAFYDLLDAARMAPSEYNGQPWRFWVTEQCIHVFMKPTKLFATKLRHRNERVSIGCMLANLFTKAELDACLIERRYEHEPFESIKDLTYVVSLYIREHYDLP